MSPVLRSKPLRSKKNLAPWQKMACHQYWQASIMRNHRMNMMSNCLQSSVPRSLHIDLRAAMVGFCANCVPDIRYASRLAP